MPSKPAKASVTETDLSGASNLNIFNIESGSFVSIFIFALFLFLAKLDVSSFTRPSTM